VGDRTTLQRLSGGAPLWGRVQPYSVFSEGASLGGGCSLHGSLWGPPAVEGVALQGPLGGALEGEGAALQRPLGFAGGYVGRFRVCGVEETCSLRCLLEFVIHDKHVRLCDTHSLSLRFHTHVARTHRP